jgi:FMN phosphatase YigB (HAD superfamily)
VIRLVTFDFWETLVQDSADNLARQRMLRIESMARVLTQSGEHMIDGQVEEGHDRSQEVLVERYWSRHRDPSCHEQVRLVLDCMSSGLADRLGPTPFAEAVRAYISPVLACPPELNEGAASAVRTLHARGVTLAVISNTGRTPGVVLRQVLARHGLVGLFDVFSYSDEVGYRKPDPEIFLRTVARAAAVPAVSAHVGDNPVDDVAGAQGAGMRGIHFAAPGRAPAAHADLVVTNLANLPDRLFA